MANKVLVEKITNRHIARLLDRLKPLSLPEIAESEIKRQMWFLSEDIAALNEQGEPDNAVLKP